MNWQWDYKQLQKRKLVEKRGIFDLPSAIQNSFIVQLMRCWHRFLNRDCDERSQNVTRVQDCFFGIQTVLPIFPVRQMRFHSFKDSLRRFSKLLHWNKQHPGLRSEPLEYFRKLRSVLLSVYCGESVEVIDKERARKHTRRYFKKPQYHRFVLFLRGTWSKSPKK